MSFSEQIVTIGVAVLGTMITRFLPFLVFPADKPTPAFVQFLGKALPPAVFGMLVIYCMKDVTFTAGTYGLPELLSIAAVVAVHVWKRQMLISIATGTILYMALIQLVF